MNNDELIARSEAALEGVTEGPWKLRLYQSGTVQVMIREWADGSPDTRQGGSTYGYHSAYMSMHNIGTRDDAETDNEKYRNGKFIAESRDLVPALIAALKASEARAHSLENAVGWYGHQVRLCRRHGKEGDEARNTLSEDGGQRAVAALKGGTQ